MDDARSPPGSVRRHGRNISHPLRQSAGSDPLDAAVDDPLAATPASPSAVLRVATAESTQPTEVQDVAERDPEPEISPFLGRHLLFLSNPDAYNRLSASDVPKAFFEADRQPAPDSELANLLQSGHFRAAAEKAVRELLASDNDPPQHLLHLLYVRLACLVLISRPDVAAQEAVPILDFLAHNPPGAEDIVPLMPWDLRLLLVRLQSISASDGGRRGIMALYALATEVRSHLALANDHDDTDEGAIWSARLNDLGLRVCDALVEMGELETAMRHLDSLQDVDSDEAAYRKSLLQIRIGNIDGARQSAESFEDGLRKKYVHAIIDAADGDFSAAPWEDLMREYPSHELFAQNAAVSLLYTGHIDSAREVLEDLADRLPMFPTLLFNLSTIYELCSERSIVDKEALAEKAAAKTPVPDSGGWERATFEFKL